MKPISRVETGIVGFDWMLGGGLPIGRIVELYGFEGSGKTTLAAEIAKVMQEAQPEKVVVFLDYEHSVDVSYFKKLGVGISDNVWLYAQPDYMEQGLDAASTLMETGEVSCLIIDSVASMVPKAELEGTIEDYSIGLQARKMGQALRKMTGLFETTGTIGIFINQLRDKVGGNPYEKRFDPTVTPGGRALKFYASIRLEMKVAGKDDNGVRLHRIKLKKQKTCAVQTATTEIKMSSNGIDRHEHFVGCLINTGIVENRAGSYFLKGQTERIARGMEELSTVVESQEIHSTLKQRLFECWSNTGELNGSDVTE